MVTLSSDVRLPRGTTPDYPPICPGCLGDAPTSLHKVKRARIFSPLMFLSPLLEWLWPGRTERAEIPACPACVDLMRKQAFARETFGYACVALAIAAAIWTGVEFGRESRWLLAGIGLLAFLPQVAWEILSARIFDLTVFKETVDYEFRDRDYARAFAERNGGKVE